MAQQSRTLKNKTNINLCLNIPSVSGQSHTITDKVQLSDNLVIWIEFDIEAYLPEMSNAFYRFFAFFRF